MDEGDGEEDGGAAGHASKKRTVSMPTGKLVPLKGDDGKPVLKETKVLSTSRGGKMNIAPRRPHSSGATATSLPCSMGFDRTSVRPVHQRG